MLTTPEHWEIPNRPSPKPAVMIRTGPKPQLPPTHSYRPKPQPVQYHEYTFGDVHAKRGTFKDSAKDLIVRPIFGPKTTKGTSIWPLETANKAKKMFEEGYTTKVIAETIGMPASATRKKLWRMGCKRNLDWTEDKVRTIRKMHEEGHTKKQIADHFGVGVPALYGVMKRYRIGVGEK